MRKIKEVLRLRFELGLGLRAIARSCSFGLETAHEYLQRAEAAGVTWPLGEGWGEDRLEAALFGGPPRHRPAVLPTPDFAEMHRQRQLHPHLRSVEPPPSSPPPPHDNIRGPEYFD